MNPVSVAALSYDARERNRNLNYGGSQAVRHTHITETDRAGRQTDGQTGRWMDRQTGSQPARQPGNN